MKLSHSKLSTIMGCPMTYYLTYKEGISKKETKPALAIGSAVHWGIEHGTEDLTQYYIDNGTAKNRDNYTREQLLSEAMVHGYLKHKDEIFDQILTNIDTGEKYQLLEESHELFVEGNLQTNENTPLHKFIGIVDLLLLTDKGFIVIDYKTSTYAPDWSKYLDQIYRYIFMLNTTFPDIPIVKIGIINIRKTAIRQKKTENTEQFLNRMKLEYDINDENYVNYHEYSIDALDSRLISDYTKNLSKQCDLAHLIDETDIRFINYANAEGPYGKSDFWDIFYHTPDAHVLYKIRDYIWNDATESFDNSRDCRDIDMHVIDSKCFNHYDYYYALSQELQTADKAAIYEAAKERYDIVDDVLFDMYYSTYIHEGKDKSC